MSDKTTALPASGLERPTEPGVWFDYAGQPWLVNEATHREIRKNGSLGEWIFPNERLTCGGWSKAVPAAAPDALMVKLQELRETIEPVLERRSPITGANAQRIDLQQIVELGKRATARPYRFRSLGIHDGKEICDIVPTYGVGPIQSQRENAEYIAAAANSADIMAQQLLALQKLRDKAKDEARRNMETMERGYVDVSPLMVSVEEVAAILEGQAFQ